MAGQAWSDPGWVSVRSGTNCYLLGLTRFANCWLPPPPPAAAHASARAGEVGDVAFPTAWLEDIALPSIKIGSWVIGQHPMAWPDGAVGYKTYLRLDELGEKDEHELLYDGVSAMSMHEFSCMEKVAGRMRAARNWRNEARVGRGKPELGGGNDIPKEIRTIYMTLMKTTPSDPDEWEEQVLPIIALLEPEEWEKLCAFAARDRIVRKIRYEKRWGLYHDHEDEDEDKAGAGAGAGAGCGCSSDRSQPLNSPRGLRGPRPGEWQPPPAPWTAAGEPEPPSVPWPRAPAGTDGSSTT